MGLKDALPKMPKIGATHYLTIIVFLGLLNASIGLAYVEAKNSEITVLHIEGAPERRKRSLYPDHRRRDQYA